MLISNSTTCDLDAMNTELRKLMLLPAYGKFTTSATTAKICVPNNFRRFRILGWMFASQPAAADGTLAVDSSVHTIGADGVHQALQDSSGNYYIQFYRPAGTTSGLDFFVTIGGVP